MFGFNRSNAEELTAEARKVNERFNSFKTMNILKMICIRFLKTKIQSWGR